jgi:catechol 2,3-dioxygenase-like lactoylglutathione lyase family enzyme
VITGSHAIIYAEDPEAARTFFRDVLELSFVDSHGGWLIFKLPPAELGIHPSGSFEGSAPAIPSGHHQLYLMCDDIESTVADLLDKGVRFSGPIEDQGFGLVVGMELPGAGSIGLYEPKHLTAYDLE